MLVHLCDVDPALATITIGLTKDIQYYGSVCWLGCSTSVNLAHISQLIDYYLHISQQTLDIYSKLA